MTEEQERLFTFCLEAIEEPDLAPIYGDFTEDLGYFRHNILTEYIVSVGNWIGGDWGICLFCPLQKVTLEDRQPFEVTIGYSWADWEQPNNSTRIENEDNSKLPQVILRYFQETPDNSHAFPHRWLVAWKTKAEALCAVSQALIHWGQDKTRQTLGIHLVC